MRRSLLVCAVLAVLSAATVHAATAEGFNQDLNVVWRTVEGQSLRADFYWPATGCPCRGIVEMHGGGFVTGTRLWNTDEATRLAQNGFYVMNTDYRLTGDYQPALDDAIAAVGYLQHRPGIDRTHIGAHGSSAGAVLTTMLCVLGTGVQVDAGVAWSGGVDGALVTDDSMPLALVTSQDDPTVDPYYSFEDYQAYQTAGRPTDLMVRPGDGHGLDFKDDPAVWGETINWLTKYLMPAA